MSKKSNDFHALLFDFAAAIISYIFLTPSQGFIVTLVISMIKFILDACRSRHHVWIIIPITISPPHANGHVFYASGNFTPWRFSGLDKDRLQ